MYFANILDADMLEKKFSDAKLTESYSGALIIMNEEDLPIDKINELNVIAAIQPKINPGSYNDTSQILFICKYSDPEAVYEEYNFTKDPIILIKLWSVIRHNEQEDSNRSFLSGLGNFDIPKIVITHEETTFEIAYFDLKDHQDEDSKIDAFINLICDQSNIPGWLVSVADKNIDPPILRIRIGVYRDPDNGCLKQRMYLLTYDDTTGCILKNSEGYCGSYYSLSTSDRSKYYTSFVIYGDAWIEQEPKQKETSSSNRKEYDLNTSECDGKYILILIKDNHNKKNELDPLYVTVLKKDGYPINTHTVYVNNAFKDGNLGALLEHTESKLLMSLHSKAPFIILEILNDDKDVIGVFDTYEEAKTAYDVISEQSGLDYSNFYHYTPYIAQLHFIDPNHCVAIYTKEKE